jgi:glyoxylase-like metal-dependent hydrolase (beta-lactamase superfamily II)
VTHFVYSHHHADHTGASSLFDKGVVRIGHEETRRLLLRDDDPARPAPEETFQDRRTLEIGGERIDLAWRSTWPTSTRASGRHSTRSIPPLLPEVR